MLKAIHLTCLGVEPFLVCRIKLSFCHVLYYSANYDADSFFDTFFEFFCANYYN